jgi:hypothetical protein
MSCTLRDGSLAFAADQTASALAGLSRVSIPKYLFSSR